MSSVQERKTAADSGQSPEGEPAAAGSHGLLGGALAWCLANRLRAAMLAGGLLLSVASLAAFAVVWMPRGATQPAAQLNEALVALDRGEFMRARKLAEEYEKKADPSLPQSGESWFVRGAATAYEADNSSSENRDKHYLLAARLLGEAKDRGFSTNREAEGLYLLGKSLLRSGQCAASRPVLRDAMKLWPERRGELHYLLAEGYLVESEPRLDLAMNENNEALSHTPDGSPRQHPMLVQRGEIFLATNKLDEALAAIDKIPETSAALGDSLVVRSRVLMQQAAAVASANPTEAKMKYAKAVELLGRAQGGDTLVSGVSRKAIYLTGLCLSASGDRSGAMSQFARVRRVFPGTPEALAAAFQEAEMLAAEGKQEAASGEYYRVLDSLVDTSNYRNPWLPLEPLRGRMLAIYTQRLEGRQFGACVALAKHLASILPKERSTELIAEGQSAWGHALLKDAETQSGQQAATSLREGRRHLREAGASYSRLANLQMSSRNYPDLLWNSAQALLDGHDFAGAIPVLEEYLKNEARKRHPEALVSLGDALLAEGRVEESLKALSDCMQMHPRHAAVFRARLLASRCQAELGKDARAESLLMENLGDEMLTPSSGEWRESLVDLAILLHRQRRYEAAIARLAEAMQRYPDSPRAVQCAYLQADAHRQRAYQLQDELSKLEVEQTRDQAAAKRLQSLRAALDQFTLLRQSLEAQQDKSPLGALEKTILRNCRFAVGDLLFEFGRYDEAIQAYREVIQRASGGPEVLEAYVQIAQANRQLNRPADARNAIDQAKLALERIKPEANFAETTNYNRKEWRELLDSL